MLTASMTLFSKYARLAYTHTHMQLACYALHATRSNNTPISRKETSIITHKHHTSIHYTPASQHRWKLRSPQNTSLPSRKPPNGGGGGGGGGNATHPSTRRAARTTPYIALFLPISHFPTYPPSVYHAPPPPGTKPLPEGRQIKIARTRK